MRYSKQAELPAKSWWMLPGSDTARAPVGHSDWTSCFPMERISAILEDMFFEFRQYTVLPGKRAEWVKYMESVIIPFQASKGMVVIGSFVDEEDENLYYWIRRFKNEKERERLYKKVYESPEWKNEIGPRVGELLDRKKIVVKRIVPTPKSIIE